MIRYWNERYEVGLGAGNGSRGRLYEFKLKVVQDLVKKYKIKSVVDVGCGDGRQLAKLKVDEYRGMDISDVAITMANAYSNPPARIYQVMDPGAVAEGRICDMSVSLGVMHHLPDDMLDAHLELLFGLAKRYVLIYGPDHDGHGIRLAPHMHFRKFTRYIARKMNKKPVLTIENDYKPVFVGQSIRNDTTYSEFFLYSIDEDGPEPRKSRKSSASSSGAA